MTKLIIAFISFARAPGVCACVTLTQQIPHTKDRVRTWAFGVKGLKLTAWVIARLSKSDIHLNYERNSSRKSYLTKNRLSLRYDSRSINFFFWGGGELLVIAEIVQHKCIMWTKCRNCKCYSKWYMWLSLSFKRLPGTPATRITQLQVMQFQIRAIFKKTEIK